MKRISPISPVIAILSGAAFLSGICGANAQTYTFLPTTGNTTGSNPWNADGTWNTALDAGFPNAAGDVAQRTSGTSSTFVSQNVVGGVTVGTILSTGNTANTWTLEVLNAIILNQDGAGAGSAAITRNSSNVGARIDFTGGGGITLADNLIITNVNGNSASGSVALRTVISGTGNITVNNSSNNATAGHVRFEAANTFDGDTTIASGAVTFNNNQAFGTLATNDITLGSSGGGSASLIASNAAGNLANDIVVAAGSGGTLLLGTVSTSTSANAVTYSGTVTLNDHLSITSGTAGTGFLTFSNTISGDHSVTILDNNADAVGRTRFTGVNTYTGDTTVTAGAFLSLTSTSEIRFVLQDGDISNQVLGAGEVSFGGLFRLDISDLTSGAGSWTLVNVGTLTETFDAATFNLAFVNGPTFSNAGGGLYTSGDWSFDTATGVLSAVPEPSTWTIAIASLLGLIVLRRRASRV